ncbi:hypothetical protein SDC9_159367 [bioreactor metagenome]|uniref:Uncharacterized protein n=1 Tax=bioreactor metagenome TaxID=1076179 RepID=A0A645FCP8_9ZZZZ
MQSKRVHPLFNPLRLHGFSGVVRGLHQAKTRRERECFVQAQRTKHLLGDDIAAAVAGDDHGVELLFVERIVDQHACEAVDKREDVCAHAVVIVRAEQQKRIALIDRGKHIVCDHPAVEAAVLPSKMRAGFIGTAPAIENCAVLERDFVDVAILGNPLGQRHADLQSVGGCPIARVQQQHLWSCLFLRQKTDQPLHEFPRGLPVCPHEGNPAPQGLYVPVVERTRRFHQRLARKAAAREIRRESQHIRRLLGVEFARAVEQNRARCALHRLRVLPERRDERDYLHIQPVLA